MKKTKAKILSVAIEVFNERGYSSVNLRELSEMIGVSRGNLTYHFKDKEELLEAIVTEMWDHISVEMSKTLEVPSFENMHHRTKLYYDFQKRYAFVFLDIRIQMHHAVHDQFKSMIDKTIDNYSQMISLGIQIGTVKKEEVPGTYRSLIHAVWMTSFYRLAQQQTRNLKEEKDSEMLIWGLIIPHLTKKGLEGFRAYFGEDNFSKIDKPFDVKKHAFITF